MAEIPKLSAKQIDYTEKATKRWNLKVGAVRSGKSYVDIAAVIPERIISRLKKPGRTAFFGVSRDTIERNILEPMREIYGDGRIGTINSRNVCKVFGQTVDCIGVEKANAIGKIQGMSLKYAYGDEIAKWNPSVFAMIESRMDKEYSCFDGACNPEGPNHWFKKWLDNPKLDAYIQEYVLFDNPFLPKAFIKSLCNEYEGTVYYDRYILGKWALAEGLIYPMYQQALAEPPERAVFDDYVVSIDYGTENAFAAIKWAYDKQAHIWYALEEYYYSGRTTGQMKTDEEYADDLERFCKPILDRYRDLYTQAVKMDDPFASLKKLRLIIDPSAASFVAAMQKRKGFKVTKADNNVSDGIRDTAVAMKLGLIKINPHMANTRDELEGYVWDERYAESGEDKPVKVKDHACDSIRYFVKTMHLVQKEQNRRKRERNIA